jgi:ubiquinone/menaquinone biosynthesis C-methylase UbiE
MRRPRRIVAADHREAYDLWARHFSDPALMTNRDRRATEFKLGRIVEQLVLGPETRLLDVGPGDGTLFRLVAGRVRRCAGVDPIEAAVDKLRRLFAGESDVEFRIGSAEEIPYADGSFDTVVVNSVLHVLPSREHVERALAELARVCAPAGTIFVGELPFRPELASGIRAHLARKLRESGPCAFVRLLYSTYVRPVLRGEPIILYPARNLHVPQSDLESMCDGLGLRVECQRHREMRKPSETRNDYVLTRGS